MQAGIGKMSFLKNTISFRKFRMYTYECKILKEPFSVILYEYMCVVWIWTNY